MKQYWNKISGDHPNIAVEKNNFTDQFSILHINARSMKNKLEDIINFITRTGVQWDIICFSETWLKNDILQYFQMENYNLFASCRLVGEGGGTAVYVHIKHEYEERKYLNCIDVETNFVQVKLRSKIGTRCVLVGGMYRPPNYSSNAFLSYMEKVLATIEDERKFAIIAGDFNFNLLPMMNDKCSNDFLNLMSSYSFFPMISKATRIQKQTETLLDNIFVNNLALYHSSGIMVDDLSDHLPVFMTLKIKSICRENRDIVTVFDSRKMKDLNTFLVSKLRDFQTNTDADIASYQLVNAYTEGIQLFSKSYKPSRRKSTMKPWITPSILCSINKKTQLYNKFIRRGNETNEQNYKTYRNVLVKVIRDAKRL